MQNENDAGVNKSTAKISAVLTDATSGSEDGELRFQTAGPNGAGLGDRLTIDSTGNVTISGFTTDANAVLYTTTGGVVTRVVETETGSQCLLSGAGVSGVPVWGSCGGGAQTPWGQDIDADGFDLTDLSNIQFRDTTGAPAGSVAAIFSDSAGTINLNVTTGDTFDISVNGTDEYNFSATTLDFNANTITDVGNITATAAITIASTGAGNDVIINGADIFDVQDNSVFTGTATFNALATFNTDVDMTFAAAENLNITNTTLNSASNLVDIAPTLTGDVAAEGLHINITHSGTGSTATNYGLGVTNLNNAGNTNVIDALALFSNNQATETLADGIIIRHNASSGTLTDALQIENTTAGGTITNAINILETAGTVATGINIGNNIATGISIGTGVTTAFTASSGDIVTSNLGVNYTQSDANPGCAANEFKIYADDSENKLKKCQNGTASDLDTTGGGATVKSGVQPVTEGTPVTVTFATAFSTTPYCAVSVDLSGSGSASGGYAWLDSAPTTAQVVFNYSDNAGGAAKTENVNWICTDAGDADLAEIYPTNDTTIQPGELVSIDPNLQNGVLRTTKSYDQYLMGVVSTSPGLVIGSNEGIGRWMVPVALVGRVPVKVNSENGPIRPGDLLTSSSKPGVAMKATKAGYIIGRALTSFNGEGEGLLVAFVNTHYANPTQLDSYGDLVNPDLSSTRPVLATPSALLSLDSENNLVASVSASTKFVWENSAEKVVAWVSDAGEAFFQKVTALVGDFQKLVFGELAVKKDAQTAGEASFAANET
ncbi:MAG: hypothetical protein A2Z24_01040, partial [Candidatus Woykebacteria bacterium RBG_16_44_10]